MKRLTIFLMMCCLTSVAFSDWNPGDPYKMHYPQLPNPDGWDVEIFRDQVADDWQCSQSGPVTDIHFWISWAQDDIGQVDVFELTVYRDVPAGVGGANYSRPGEMISSRIYNASEFVVRDYGMGDQGFYDPENSWAVHDHQQFLQVNIVAPDDPLFYQQEGEIYWLSISADWSGIQSPVGWKTSLDAFNDAAVYWSDATDSWQPLYDPALAEQGQTVPLDMAFVITPEPVTMILLGFGSLVLIKKR